MLLCASLQQCSAFLSPGHKHVLQISVPAADLSPVAPSPPCRSPPALVAAPAVWPSAASAYPSPCLRQQNQLVSDRKAKTCFLNSWALFFYFLLSLTTKQSPPLTPGASDQVERWQRCLFLCFAVQGKWKVKSEVFGCLLTTFSRRGLINTTNPFFFFCQPSKYRWKQIIMALVMYFFVALSACICIQHDAYCFLMTHCAFCIGLTEQDRLLRLFPLDKTQQSENPLMSSHQTFSILILLQKLLITANPSRCFVGNFQFQKDE